MKLSTIVATCNRPKSLERLMLSLAEQLGVPERELLIAENGSSERSPVPPMPVSVVHLFDRNPGKCRMQNRAIETAHGEVLIFLDDDLVAAPDYLDQVERFFVEHPEFAAMKGRVLPDDDPAALLGDSAVYLDLPLVDHGDAVIEVPGVIGANMAFRFEALHNVGFFDERLGPGAAGHEEETEMSARLRRHGYRIGYAPGAIVYHEIDPARADRERFVRIARERGRCRVIHETHHRIRRLAAERFIARIRLAIARAIDAPPQRIAREEKRLAILDGMLEGLRQQIGKTSARAPDSN